MMFCWAFFPPPNAGMLRPMLKRMVGVVAAIAAIGGAAAWSVGAANAGDPETPPVVAAFDPVGELVAAAAVEDCSAAGYEDAAAANARTLGSLSWSPWGRAEKGWETYAPMVGKTIGTGCAVESPGFARALAMWESANGHAPDGTFDAAVFTDMKGAWQSARPFVAVRAEGVCPAPPTEAGLVTLAAEEGYMGKRVQLRADVAQAYRAMVAAARAEDPAIAADLEALDVFSGYRSPAYDDARCARDGNCGGITRAKCSAHRTGYAFDLVVGHAPGHSVDSTNDANRLHMSKTPAYRWMVANAERFGFVNYVFEPWHWEFQGEPAAGGLVQASVN